MAYTTRYQTIKHAVRDLLKQNAKDLSDGVGGRVGYIECVNPEVAQIPADQFPAVCIYRRSKAGDEGAALGGVRVADLTLEVTCMVLVAEDAESADDAVEMLADNIEYELRTTPKLGLANVKGSVVGETTFDTVRGEDGTSIIAMATIDLVVTPLMT